MSKSKLSEITEIGTEVEIGELGSIRLLDTNYNGTGKKMNNNLRLLRKQKKLSALELANKSGVALATIYHLEKGILDIGECKISTLVAIASALKVKARHLFVDKKIKNKL